MEILLVYMTLGQVYYTIPPHECHGGKLGQARALKGYFVGYSYSKYLQPCNLFALSTLYGLTLRGGDLVGAYLVAPGSKEIAGLQIL